MIITYKILICDDNVHYIKRLRDELNDVSSKSESFQLSIDVGTTPSECLNFIQNIEYEIIILDTCISADSPRIGNYSDLLRSSAGVEYYGPELYKQIVVHNSFAKVFVLSNLETKESRTIYDNASIDYFNKSQTKVSKIAQHIKNYFDTGKNRILNNVFVVYGHNHDMRTSIESYIKSIGLNSIDLFNQSLGGIQSVFDALDECADSAECAIVLLSADDIVLDKDNLQMLYRARQNVIFEMGLFLGHLGKNKVIVIYEEHKKFEFPSDISGVFYIRYNKDNTVSWESDLKASLKKIGFDI